MLDVSWWSLLPKLLAVFPNDNKPYDNKPSSEEQNGGLKLKKQEALSKEIYNISSIVLPITRICLQLTNTFNTHFEVASKWVFMIIAIKR